MTRDDLRRLEALDDQALGEMVAVHFTAHERHVGEFRANAELAARVPALTERLVTAETEVEASKALNADLDRRLAKWHDWHTSMTADVDVRSAAEAKRLKELAEAEALVERLKKG